MVSDAAEAVKIYERYNPDIVVADLILSDLKGFAVVEEIKAIDKEAMIVVLSSCKKIEMLSKAIDLTVFQYLIKPLSAHKLSQALIKAILLLDEREQKIHFQTMHEVFHFQDTLMVKFQQEQMVEANDSFLSFFNVDSVADFIQKYQDIIDYMIAKDVWVNAPNFCSSRDNFLSSHTKVFNIRLSDSSESEHHFFLSVYKSFNGQEMILSFKDVTAFNFLQFFDLDEGRRILKSSLDQEKLRGYVEAIFESGASIKFRNFYKGLPIIRQAELQSITSEQITLQANPRLFRAIELEGKTRLESLLLPQVMMLDTIEKLDDSEMTVSCSLGHFVSRTAITRRSIRLAVAENHLVALMKHDEQLPMGATIIDISIEAVKLRVDTWMDTLSEGDEIEIDMVLNVEAEKTIINTNTTIHSIKDEQTHHEVICVMKLTPESEASLQNYINSRQAELNREFKALI
jgi:CheY-like chemotaxis protein